MTCQMLQSHPSNYNSSGFIFREEKMTYFNELMNELIKIEKVPKCKNENEFKKEQQEQEGERGEEVI